MQAAAPVLQNLCAVVCEHVFSEQREQELLRLAARWCGEERVAQLWSCRLQQLLPKQRRYQREQLRTAVNIAIRVSRGRALRCRVTV